jgi:hypothetical protein
VHLARGANALDAAHTLAADAVSGKTATFG